MLVHASYTHKLHFTNGLSVMVEQQFALTPFAAHLCVFCNGTRDKIKILYWERNGFCLWYKQLEQERFQWPLHLCDATVSMIFTPKAL
ncbi:MAG TPA: IS66 family insertion sequence element accessory protein TnpB [Aquirhabdus sp.]